ncbi:uncharacterized protein LOC112198858 [Rosa chinensis]|uniref:uncharacterized protein LOC112198858 n=1 Tax=Rosa chinensis TaxID=74649 RepID=UPI000D08F0C9|nr:uncharacterized protein LOC112198858 [Rosa chinensis]
MNWQSIPATSIQEWLIAVASQVNKEVMNKVIMLMWGIWKNRNAQVWDQKSKHASEAYLFTMGWYEDFKKSTARPPQQSREPIRWQPPTERVLKMNCDGAYQAASRHGGVGCVLQNSDGIFLACQVRPYAFLMFPFHAELAALKDGIIMAQTMQHSEVIFESDCALLVQAIQMVSHDLSTMNVLIEEVRSLLRDNPGFSIIHVKREANKIAHLLASHAIRNNVSQLWLVTAPEFMRDDIRNNVIVI